ncbi:MAG: phospholipase [Thermoguttaceae bacterium]|jgi:predicted  nucleic acid-binding Zn-ribbon protein|nr:phospholipase [Thermoguttaceae bacterium]
MTRFSQKDSVNAGVLRTLHRIHRQLADLRERRARGPRQLRNADAHVAHQEQLLATVQAEEKAMRVAADKKQLDLKAAEARIEDLRRKLNMASSNKEYQTLKEQIAAVEMANSVLADEILEAFERIDAMHPRIAEAEASLEKAREKAGQTHSDVEREMPLVEADITRLEADLSETEVALPADAKELYQRVVRQRGEDALAAVENQTCLGCYTGVPLNACNQILLGYPIFCKTCGRLLYIPEQEQPEEA